MLGNKDTRKNRFRKKTVKAKRKIRLAALLKFFGGTAALAALSLGLIFCHDLITQIAYFRAETVTVTGNHRIERDEILSRARVAPGMNILGLNLAAIRKRLVAHPWIAEAFVRREIPRAIHIRIEEHRAAAILELGRKFLVDSRGVIFKALAEGEQQGLPMIRGLRFSDVRIEATGRTGERRASVYDDVIAVLNLGKAAATALPIPVLEQIEVDREIGLKLKTAGPEPLEVRLGFSDYERKFKVLEMVLDRLKQPQMQQWQGIRFIDLNDPSRIVVRPRLADGNL